MTMSDAYSDFLHETRERAAAAPAPLVLELLDNDGVMLRDQLGALLQQEAQYAIHHVPCRRPTSNRPELEEWRRKICQWGYRVIDHFRLDREVVAVGMNIFDRFLVQHNQNCMDNEAAASGSCPCPSCRRLLDSRTYQLAAMTSLYLAIKVRVTCEEDSYDEDGFPSSCYTYSNSNSNSSAGQQGKLTFRLQSFVELSRGQFVVEDICEMEQTLLATVQWRVHPPTPMLFVSYLLSTLLPMGQSHRRFDLVLHVVRELARYCTELAVCLGHDCSRHPASAVAFAAIVESMDLLTLTALPQDLRDVFVQRARRIRMVPPDLQLRAALRKALWPELISDNDVGSDQPASTQRHPITMARDFGLLDVDRLYPAAAPTMSTTPPLSPKRYAGRHHQQASPISVRR